MSGNAKKGTKNSKTATKEKDTKDASKLPNLAAGNKASSSNSKTSSSTQSKKPKDPEKLPEKLPAIATAASAPIPSIVDKDGILSNEKTENVEKVENSPADAVDMNAKEDTPVNISISELPSTLEGSKSEPVPKLEPEPILEPVPPPKEPQNGKVILIYEQYNEEFDILDGSTTHENIDEVYCLSFVMPNCLVHLSNYNPQEKREMEAAGNLDYFIEENPRGTYHGLEVGKTYYVYVEQEAEQLARDQARMKEIAGRMEGAKAKTDIALTKDDGRVLESCSCIYGNPCVDEYGCKDWGNRFAIATQNGWKGF